MHSAPKKRLGRGPCACAAAALITLTAGPAVAAPIFITSADIATVPKGTVGSGNGTLDLILFTESAGGALNTGGGFNGDNGNTQLPTGTGNATADESYVTSFGELRDFFVLNFPNGTGGSTVNEIVVMVDVNETGGPQSIDLGTFDVWLNASVTPAGDDRNDPLNHDLTSAQQNGTNTSFSGGTKLAQLDGTKVLGQVETGAGFPDKAIFTGINPFDPAYSASDRFLLHWASADHDNGGESIFLSGKVGPSDIEGVVPEPAALGVLAIGGLALAGRRRRAAR